MSGRVQKESGDESDRIDDAVDPRVQVNQYILVRIIYRLLNLATCDIDISTLS